jgi:hypothetical protein
MNITHLHRHFHWNQIKQMILSTLFHLCYDGTSSRAGRKNVSNNGSLELENSSLASDPKSVRIESGSVVARGTLLRRMRNDSSSHKHENIRNAVHAATKRRQPAMSDKDLEMHLSPRSDNHGLVPDAEKLKLMQDEEADFWLRFLTCSGGGAMQLEGDLEVLENPDEILHEAYSRLRNPSTIPTTKDGLRNKVWLHLLSITPDSLLPGGKWHTTFHSCLQHPDPEDNIERIILRDVPRTFAGWSYFSQDSGLTLETFNPHQHEMYDVLRAYSKYDIEVGYCQGMSFVVAAMLMMGFNPIESFAILIHLMYGFVPFLSAEPDVMTNRSTKKTYPLRLLYLPSMPGLHTLLHLVSHFLSKLLPRLSSHLDDLGVPAGVWCSQWILTLWTYSFPRRAWDHGWSRLLAQATDNIPSCTPTLSRSDRYTKAILDTTHDTLPGILLDLVLICLAYLKTAEDGLLEISDAEQVLVQLRGDHFFTKENVLNEVHFQAEEWLRMDVISAPEIQQLRQNFEDTIVTLPRRQTKDPLSDPLMAIPSPTLSTPVANSTFELQALVADLVQRNRKLVEKLAIAEAENEQMRSGFDGDLIETLAQTKAHLAVACEERDRLNLRVRALTTEVLAIREKAAMRLTVASDASIEEDVGEEETKHRRQGSFAGLFGMFRKTHIPEAPVPEKTPDSVSESDLSPNMK